MHKKRRTTLKNILLTIGLGIIVLSSLSMSVIPLKTTMASSHQLKPSNPVQDNNNACISGSEQTVIHWVDMRWFSCRLSLFGICIWPPLLHNHATYKVTINNGVPLLDEHNQPIAIANGKTRNWTVYDSNRWNNIANSPRRLARFPGYKPIEPNEYVVMVETRYRLFNDVESTLRICVNPDSK